MSVTELEESYGAVISDVARDLQRALPRETLIALAVYVAASELLVETMQPRDAGTLRLATLRMALEVLGLTDNVIESAKMHLIGTHERPFSLRSN